jgi:hypothetical protein
MGRSRTLELELEVLVLFWSVCLFVPMRDMRYEMQERKKKPNKARELLEELHA